MRWQVLLFAAAIAAAGTHLTTAGDASAHPNALMNMSAANAAQWLKNGRADRFVYERTPQRVLKVRTRRAGCVPMRPWIKEEGGTWVKHARCRARAVATIGHEECVPVYDDETGEYLYDDCNTVVDGQRCMRYRLVVHFIDWVSFQPLRASLRFSQFGFRLRC
jgi:hypothetical protein